MYRACFITMVLILAACGPGKTAPATQIAVPTATALPPTAVMPQDERLQAEQDYEELLPLQGKIGDVWEKLKSGQQASCKDSISPPEPDLMPNFYPVQIELRNAAISLREAILLWQAECQNPRSQILPDVIDRGVLLVRSAGDALTRASGILSGSASP